jgi:Flp pilus assembly protein TadD
MGEEAEKVYRTALAADPEAKQLNYNLGLLLWQRGDKAAAKELIRKATKQGMQLSPEVRAAMNATE